MLFSLFCLLSHIPHTTLPTCRHGCTLVCTQGTFGEGGHTGVTRFWAWLGWTNLRGRSTVCITSMVPICFRHYHNATTTVLLNCAKTPRYSLHYAGSSETGYFLPTPRLHTTEQTPACQQHRLRTRAARCHFYRFPLPRGPACCFVAARTFPQPYRLRMGVHTAGATAALPPRTADPPYRTLLHTLLPRTYLTRGQNTERHLATRGCTRSGLTPLRTSLKLRRAPTQRLILCASHSACCSATALSLHIAHSTNCQRARVL